ncbi:Phosphodiesterase [Caenorhabditis elegans]|nr:Phosphodiesterase [Caenorhabditis elegans]CDH93187.1 Phosphodiesterase [Caenorhabditis elegans]|eukprot:NP_001293572.1 Phosphodiesterase [Caenorhabditis elegans]
MRKNRDTATSSPASSGVSIQQRRGSTTQNSGVGSIGLPVLGGRGRGVMSDGHMQRTFHEAMRQRRTSLPANSLSLNGAKVTGSSLSEAKGLIADMLMNKELPGNVASCLRAVTMLLEQRPLPLNGLLNDFGLPSVVENPYGGESMVVGASKPRISNITFSTVTSATGLPTVPAEPNKARSSSYWKTEASPSNNNEHETPVDLLRKISVSRKESGTHVDTVVTTIDGQRYDTRELDTDPDLAETAVWSFPIFQMSRKHPQTILSRLTYNIFQQAELFRIFKVSPIKFFNFFHALEKGYWEIPYHNRIHAADVLHGCYYLSAHPVRSTFLTPKTPDSVLTPPHPHHQHSSIMSQLSTLELMALFTAAAMHDYDHPGRTNAFLVQVEDKKAILYNDRSVLENHHAAESWKLLNKPENHFIENLDPAEMKRFRYLVLEYILATDLKQHFEIIMTFTERLTEIDVQVETDRLLIGKLLIKMADINSPTKPYGLHRQWTDRICEEFYEQGDDERRRGLPITPYMDRGDAQVAKLQDSFIAHVVSPLATAMNECGLLPILPGLDTSELIINMEHNHRKWKEQIELENGGSYEAQITCNGGTAVNGVIEEESASTSDSPDPRRDSPLDSDLSQVPFTICCSIAEEEYV